MNRSAITKDRFRRWSRHFKKNEATPLFTLGLSKDERFVLCTTEGMSDTEIKDLLQASIIMLELKIKSQ